MPLRQPKHNCDNLQWRQLGDDCGPWGRCRPEACLHEVGSVTGCKRAAFSSFPEKESLGFREKKEKKMKEIFES